MASPAWLRYHALLTSTLFATAAPSAHVAIQGYIQGSPGQGFAVNLTRDQRLIRGLEGYALVLEVDGARVEFRPELCGIGDSTPPEWILNGKFAGEFQLDMNSVRYNTDPASNV